MNVIKYEWKIEIRNIYRKAIGGHYHAGTKHYTSAEFQLAKLTDVF